MLKWATEIFALSILHLILWNSGHPEENWEGRMLLKGVWAQESLDVYNEIQILDPILNLLNESL